MRNTNIESWRKIMEDRDGEPLYSAKTNEKCTI